MGEQPARKDKPMLTLIPESERQIDYRFEFTVVGEGGRRWATTAVNSEMAEAFRPTAKEEQSWGNTHTARGSEVLEAHHVDVLDAANLVDADAVPGKTNSFGNKGSIKSLTGAEKNKLILFIPVGESGKGLARVRFNIIENFSDSLPTARDKTVALSQAVIFLFWHVKEERDESDNVDKCLKDWMSRIAEVNFTQAQLRPACTILGFEADEEQEERLTAWAKKQTTSVWNNFKPDDSEDTIMESIQELCDQMVARAASDRERPTQNTMGGSEGNKSQDDVTVLASRCCTVL